MGGVLQVVVWAVVIIGVGILALWIAAEWQRGVADADAPTADDPRDERAARTALVERPLGDADQLAARGEYAEAIHTLLLRTLQELAAGAAVKIERAHTSREILSQVPLRADAHAALATLIGTVETTHFGDEPASADDWARCRGQYQTFATAFRAGGLTTGALLYPPSESAALGAHRS